MKILIDIPDNTQEMCQRQSNGTIRDYFTGHELKQLVDTITNGTALPDNPTNGEVIRALFNDRGYFALKDRMEHTMWWNAEYKGGKA